MAKTIFISLPVADVAVSTAFYEAIGCTRDPRMSGDQAAAMAWSDTITFMLASHRFYRTLTPKPVADVGATSAALFALACESRAAVDAFAAAAVAAGGREVHGAEDLGFMYSRGVEDPDGHGFGPMWMDETAAVAAMAEGEAVA
ncbi:VOC family protein [Sphingomonas sp. CARO-RG-8B-R24-01]|uniref:VOC family protein n=1 Tax=Sphingomonas sp. CARO-RG-8B-R24-01 TaxID=2914831 RepID=UPI001F58B7DD